MEEEGKKITILLYHLNLNHFIFWKCWFNNFNKLFSKFKFRILRFPVNNENKNLDISIRQNRLNFGPCIWR